MHFFVRSLFPFLVSEVQLSAKVVNMHLHLISVYCKVSIILSERRVVAFLLVCIWLFTKEAWDSFFPRLFATIFRQKAFWETVLKTKEVRPSQSSRILK